MLKNHSEEFDLEIVDSYITDETGNIESVILDYKLYKKLEEVLLDLGLAKTIEEVEGDDELYL